MWEAKGWSWATGRVPGQIGEVPWDVSFYPYSFSTGFSTPNERQVSILLLVIQPVSHQEVIHYLESNVPDRHVHYPPDPFVQQGAYLQRGGALGTQMVHSDS